MKRNLRRGYGTIGEDGDRRWRSEMAMAMESFACLSFFFLFFFFFFFFVFFFFFFFFFFLL
jgi:hypothetical protein